MLWWETLKTQRAAAANTCRDRLGQKGLSLLLTTHTSCPLHLPPCPERGLWLHPSARDKHPVSPTCPLAPASLKFKKTWQEMTVVVVATVVILIWLPCTLCLLHARHCGNPHNSLTRYCPYTTEEETEAQRSNLTRPPSQEVAELGSGPRLLLLCPSPSPDCPLQVRGCSQDTLTPRTEPK